MPKFPRDESDAELAADEDGTFLRRWSRRKLAGEVSPKPVESPAAPTTAADATPMLTDADMPPLDTLTAADDFTPFMAPGVSDRLRNLALRKLFGAPGFNIRDGLDDYDDDYRSFGTLTKTAAAELKARLHGPGPAQPVAEPPAMDAGITPESEAGSLEHADASDSETEVASRQPISDPQGRRPA